MRIKLAILSVLVLMLTSPSSRALDWSPDGYADLFDFINDLYAIDPNAGLTSLTVLNIAAGGRAEAMGNAYSSITEDGLSLEWNPASSSAMEQTGLSVYHNNWIDDSRLESIVYTTRSDFSGLGAGSKWLYTDFSQNNQFGERVSGGYYLEGVAWLNASVRLFPGYYFWGLAAGVNLKGALRLIPDWADSSGTIQAGSGAGQSGATVILDAGLYTRFNFLKFYTTKERNTAVSLVAKNMGIPLLGDPLPSAITAGFSWRPLRPILLAIDLTKPLNLQDLSLSENIQLSTGINAAITPFLAARLGLYIRPAHFRISMGAGISLEKTDIDITYSLDQLTQFRSFNRLSIAATFKLGDRGRAQKSRQVESYYLDGLEEYARGNTDVALELWKEALALDRSFDPAREGIQSIEDTKALEERIDDIQTLD